MNTEGTDMATAQNRKTKQKKTIKVSNKVSSEKKKNTKADSSKELPKRDITAFVTMQMLSGNISILKIPRSDLEKALEQYCNENPTIDATKIPLVGFCDKNGKDEVAKAIISLSKKYCGVKGSRTAIFSKDGHSVIIFGKSAKEIISKISVKKAAKVERLKTKIKVRALFPIEKKLNCFGGEKVSDHI